MVIKKIIFTSCLTSSAFLAQSAAAQNIDYGTLHSLLGEPVTTSATGKPQLASDAPIDMEIITAEEIERSGARDIPQLLRRYAGVEVKRSFIGSADVSIRGYNQDLANRLLVLINGRQLMVDVQGFIPWGTLPVNLNEIRQIEVVKGPNSSLFGFNAQGGVINIITYSPYHDDINVAEVTLGTQQHKELTIASTFKPAKNIGARLSGGIMNEDGFKRDSLQNISAIGFTNFLGANNAHANRYINLDSEWHINDRQSVRFITSHNNGNAEFSGNFGIASLSKSDAHSYHLTYQNQTQNNGLWKLDTYTNATDSAAGVLGYSTDLYVTKLENITKPTTNHTIRTGIEYRYNRMEGEILGSSISGFEDNKFHYNLWAANGMWHWDLTDDWSFTNAVRYDRIAYGLDGTPPVGPFAGNGNIFDRIIEEFSFNSGIVHKLSDTQRARFSIARGLHLPSLLEAGGSTQFGPFVFHGDPTIQTERNLSAEIGFTQKLPQYNTELTSTLYWSHLNNVISSRFSGVQGSFGNVGNSESIGLELSAKGKTEKGIRWGSSYTYISVQDEIDNNNNDTLFEGNQPKHQISLWAGKNIGSWQIDSDLHYTSGINARITSDSINAERIDGYFVLNGRIAHKFNDSLTTSIEGYNLIEQHREGAGSNSSSYSNNVLGKSVLLSIKKNF